MTISTRDQKLISNVANIVHRELCARARKGEDINQTQAWVFADKATKELFPSGNEKGATLSGAMDKVVHP